MEAVEVAAEDRNGWRKVVYGLMYWELQGIGAADSGVVTGLQRTNFHSSAPCTEHDHLYLTFTGF